MARIIPIRSGGKPSWERCRSTLPAHLEMSYCDSIGKVIRYIHWRQDRHWQSRSIQGTWNRPCDSFFPISRPKRVPPRVYHRFFPSQQSWKTLLWCPALDRDGKRRHGAAYAKHERVRRFDDLDECVCVNEVLCVLTYMQCV